MAPAPRRLHIGGQSVRPGWEILDVNPGPGVDHVGKADDLSRFPDGTFFVIYASHVLEHLDYKEELIRGLKEWRRVLAPGGRAMISVPDLDILCRLFLEPKLATDHRFIVMRMIFGGHVDCHDYHVAGLNEEFLRGFLRQAGFGPVRRVADLGEFEDTSLQRLRGIPISLNVIAQRDPAELGPG